MISSRLVRPCVVASRRCGRTVPRLLPCSHWRTLRRESRWTSQCKHSNNYNQTPKTKSGTRQVPLSKETIQAFQRVIKKRPKAKPFVIDGRSNFLFVNQKGKPKVAIDYSTLFVRMVKKYNKHHKDNPLPHITPHTLRHTFCTRLASKNMNPKDLQYIMGHSNISITMNWYAHASIDTAKSEVQRLIA